MLPIKHFIFCLLISLIAPFQVAAGTVLFSNLTQPGDQYGPDGIGIGTNPFFPGSSQGFAATRFTVGLSSVLDSIAVPLLLTSGPVEFDAYLLTQTAGLPGTIIESFVLGGVATGNPTPLTVIESSLHPTLSAGTPYWFAVAAGPTSFGFWLFTTFEGDTSGSPDFATGSLSAGWFEGTGGPLGREGALEVSGTSVPEPAFGVLAGVGLFLCWLRGNR